MPCVRVHQCNVKTSFSQWNRCRTNDYCQYPLSCRWIGSFYSLWNIKHLAKNKTQSSQSGHSLPLLLPLWQMGQWIVNLRKLRLQGSTWVSPILCAKVSLSKILYPQLPWTDVLTVCERCGIEEVLHCTVWMSVCVCEWVNCALKSFDWSETREVWYKYRPSFYHSKQKLKTSFMCLWWHFPVEALKLEIPTNHKIRPTHKVWIS